MPRQISNRERALRERWPKFCVIVWPTSGDAWIGVARQHRSKNVCALIFGEQCTRRSDAWQSLERAMLRTAKALEEK